jgi:hypothetical protein
MEPVRIVISSGLSRPSPSGLFVYDGSSVSFIDAYPCAGLSARGGRMFRAGALRSNDGVELLVYDRNGIVAYHRLDGLGDPHDVLALDDGRVLCVSTRDNAIVSIAPDGTVNPVWRADAPLDAWHVNCLYLRDGRLFATAFGRFDTFRGWHPTLGADAGMLFDVETGEDVVTGLSQPHSPRWVDGGWLICDSAKHAVVRVEEDGRRFSIPVGGFSRGTCVIGAYAYVGVCVSGPHENMLTSAKGWISVLERESWSEVDRIAMPCGGMYDLLEVDETMLEGLRAGFRVGSNRERAFGQLAMFEEVGVAPVRIWGVGEPLLPEMCRINIRADLPATIALGDVARVICTVENVGGGFLVPAPPFPVEACYRWFDADGVAAGEGTWLHTPLPRVIVPAGSARFEVLVAPPPVAGRFTLRLTLLQEGIRWFDDVDPANAVSGVIDIVAN